jgi:hypothetical protein
MDFVVLVAEVGHPTARQEHLTSGFHRFATLLKVTELIRDPSDSTPDCGTCEPAGGSSKKRCGGYDQSADREANSKSQEAQRHAYRCARNDSGGGAGSRADSRANRTEVAYLRTNLDVEDGTAGVVAIGVGRAKGAGKA